jgi:serine phosphatase RsbU (regulator of sigma subunit)
MALESLAHRLWPDFDSLTAADRARYLAELAGVLLTLPLALVSLLALVFHTDLGNWPADWPLLLALVTLGAVLNELAFYQFVRTRGGDASYNDSTLTGVVLVTALFIFGIWAVWTVIPLQLIYYGRRLPRLASRLERWNWLRNLLFNLGVSMASLLVALAVYQALGGPIPLPDLAPAHFLPALAAVIVSLLLSASLFLTLLSVQRVIALRYRQLAGWHLVRQSVAFLALAELPSVFGILAAAIYSQLGLLALGFLLGGLPVASLLARRLSYAAVVSGQRSREVAQLERLGRAVLASPPDASQLPQLLAEHVPPMFEFHQLEIRLFSGQTLLQLPQDRPPADRAIWEWLAGHPQQLSLPAGERPPWGEEESRLHVSLCPILATDTQDPVGGIYLARVRWYAGGPMIDVQPALQVLAAQIATTLHSAEVYRRTLVHQKVQQELDFAGQIQASFLPSVLPPLPGWQLAVALEPALETSGDFYDAIALPNGKVGLLVADVADKGMGAALYMALCRTLLRTYAYEYHDRPDFVLRVANRRILGDTQADLFVSVFYGVVDPFAGTLAYGNAGHNPPVLLRNHREPLTQLLTRTGMVLGVTDGGNWQQEELVLDIGDTLVAYSDGVIDAQNPQAEFFGEARLRALLEAHRSASAREMVQAILAAVRTFREEVPPFDDITLLVLRRVE